MRLQRIYSSKLYVTSTRKDKIHAAMQDPINAELVKQLADYLDDNSKVLLRQAESDIKRETAAKDSAAETSAPSEGGGDDAPFSPGPAPAHHSFSGDVMSDFGDDDLADVDIPDDMGGDDTGAPVPDEAPAEEPEPVESVTKEGKPITSSTAVVWTTLDDVTSETETIKGTLNAREDTAGVTMLEVKDSELWIYYNDDSNLNDKMIDVISVLNSIGYTYLKFNRLARSNNAIVFDINLNTEPIKTVKEIEEAKK